MITTKEKSDFVTVNPCKACAPLGAALAFKGIENTVPLVHGSQGCATYMRRYLISHFREPIDIASTSFSEETAIFGGGSNLTQAVKNIIKQYNPQLIGIASTCLSETIGDDVSLWLKSNEKIYAEHHFPDLVYASTPSYNGSHEDGFHEAVFAVVKKFTQQIGESDSLTVLPPILSPVDLRYLREIVNDFTSNTILLPDYSETLDGGTWEEYVRLSPGGTSLTDLKSIGLSKGVVELGAGLNCRKAGDYLKKQNKFVSRIPLPIGLQLTDQFLKTLANIFQKSIPEHFKEERQRVLDSYIDGHKYLFEKKVVICGDEDLVTSLAQFCAEIGMIPCLCATGNSSGRMRETITNNLPQDIRSQMIILDGVDYDQIERVATELCPDLILGPSKASRMARKLRIPLIRVGFPVHDRFGASRILHIGYKGALSLFDTIVNAFIEQHQDSNDICYSYM